MWPFSFLWEKLCGGLSGAQEPPTVNIMKKEKGPTDNIFLNAKAMLLSSVGRLPTALVVILLISSTMAALTGVLLVLNKPAQRSTEFMPLRLEATEDAMSVNPKDLQGTWTYQTPQYAMTLTFVGDRFEWIIFVGDIPTAQFFARGNYKLVGDVMVLGIRPDLGMPYDSAQPWMKYIPIGMKDVNVRFSHTKKTLIWDVPPAEQARIVAEASSIFFDHKDGHFEWSKSE